MGFLPGDEPASATRVEDDPLFKLLALGSEAAWKHVFRKQKRWMFTEEKRRQQPGCTEEFFWNPWVEMPPSPVYLKARRGLSQAEREGEEELIRQLNIEIKHQWLATLTMDQLRDWCRRELYWRYVITDLDKGQKLIDAERFGPAWLAEQRKWARVRKKRRKVWRDFWIEELRKAGVHA